MNSSDLAEWRGEIQARMNRLRILIDHSSAEGLATSAREGIAALRRKAEAAVDPWQIADVDEAEARVVGLILHIAFGGAQIAPAVEGSVARHPRQLVYGPEDDIYTPCGAVMRRYPAGPGASDGYTLDENLEQMGRQAAAALGGADSTVLMMSSGMAAVRVPLLVMLARLRAAGQKLLVPEESWLETLTLLRQCGPDVCRTVSAECSEELAHYAADPQVGAVLFEPITNSPVQRRFDPQRFWSALAVTRPLTVLVDAAQTPLLDVTTGSPPGVDVLVAHSLTKWAAGGSQRATGGLLIVRAGQEVVTELLLARAVQRAAPARLEDAAWTDVDSTASLRSRLTRYQRNLGILAEHLHHLPVEVRYQPGSAYLVLLDHPRAPGWAQATASQVAQAAAHRGVPAGVQGTFGLSGPALSTMPSWREAGLRLVPGSGPQSTVDQFAQAVRDVLTAP
ncbi:PLP-dependent transferase [Streptomyces sp. NPDC054871]